MTHDVNKRIVLVTGASRGLGREIALRFGKAGERIVVNFLNNERTAVQVADSIVRYGGEAMLFRADVVSSADVDAMIAGTEERWGTVDVLVNNAGIIRDRLLIRMTEHDWDSVLAVNLKGSFNCCRAVSRIMSRKQRGHIINVASIVGIQGREGQANYAASKAGLIGLTKSCAKELGRKNIKVNAILPGYMPTDMGEGVSASVQKRIAQENVLGKIADPQEVAEFVYHLSLMNNVSGQVFNLDSRIV
jgi:3-oxoacyl-[acyl-carrier protein] reductase